MKFQGYIKKNWSNILSTNIPFIPCQSVLPYLRYSFFESQGQGQSSTSHSGSSILLTQFFHFISNGPDSILEIQLFQNSPWKSKIKVMVEVGVWSHTVGPASNKCTSYDFMSNKSAVAMMWPMELLTAINLLQLLVTHQVQHFDAMGQYRTAGTPVCKQWSYSIWHEYISVVWCKLNCRGVHVADEKCMEISEAITSSLQFTT